LIRAEDAARIGRGLASLSRRERSLVEARFGLTPERQALSFREIGLRHGLSKERVRVLTTRALERLRRLSADHGPARRAQEVHS
jgi:DNA-directed RNA polymerase sigma subunit (sigma70/sigma32)